MRKSIFSILILSATATAQAQTTQGMDAAVRSVMANNPELKAMRGETDAAKAEAQTQSAMPDPEVTFGYLWHSRKDVSVSQPLDWATMTGRRRAEANATADVAEAAYSAAERQIELSARRAYIAAVRGNALTRLQEARMERASRMAEIARRRLTAGSGRQADVTSTATAKAKAMSDLAKAQADLDVSLAQLQALNGGERIEVSDTTITDGPSLAGTFSEWMERQGGRLTATRLSEAAANEAKASAKVTKAENMPQFAIGYMGEFSPSESYEGVTLGLTVPLWSAKRKSQQSRLSVQAAEQRHNATAIQARAEAEALFNKALALGRVATELREALEQNDSRGLYVRAMEQGEMSASEAIMAEEVWCDAAIACVEAEAEYWAAVAEVYALVN